MFLRINTRLVPSNRSHSLRHVSALIALAFGTAFAHAQASTLTLNEALQLSLQRSSLPKAAEAAVQASREAAVKAGQLPDPMLKVGIENLPVNGADRWSTTQDFMTMRRVGIEQQWVSSDKRAARSDRAQRAVESEEGNYLADVAKVREETAKAWVTVLYAQRSLALVKALEQQSVADLTAVQASHRGAKATAGDVVQAQLAVTQTRDAVRKRELELQNAKLALSRWTTTPVETVSDQTPILESRVPHLSIEDLEKYHPAVLAARRAITLADAETTVATKERRPDWSIEAGFSQRPHFSNMISVGVSIPITVNPSQRQDRDIAERSAMGTRARLQYEDAVRGMQTEIRTLASTLSSQRERLARLKSELLPAASQQTELATAAYRAGTGSLSAVFSARKTQLEQQLQIAELEKDAALIWAKLEHQVVPHELASVAKAQQ
ncbi:TolC family protein [Noviherbaspirillum sp. Root189]|uniref:TolC family protein n=1 Tax=Noviherbaspirillum sp. Root189 TaxID=1736487 RepID=UPI000709B733|nr:TolC family protein [Noviherbaspirillum sp. Root189]KRB79519.1 transporter [Noviherbaspirillum sp. Root189]